MKTSNLPLFIKRIGQIYNLPSRDEPPDHQLDAVHAIKEQLTAVPIEGWRNKREQIIVNCNCSYPFLACREW